MITDEARQKTKGRVSNLVTVKNREFNPWCRSKYIILPTHLQALLFYKLVMKLEQ